MVDHVANREQIYSMLREELVGPSPQGKEIDCAEKIVFTEKQISYGPWKQAGSGEEILLRDSPTVRYGVGVLYPEGSLSYTPNSSVDTDKQITDGYDDGANSEMDQIISENYIKSINEILERSSKDKVLEETDDFNLLSVNSYQPSSMGISFLAEFKPESIMLIKVTGGRYRKKKIEVEGEERLWWLRSPVSIEAEYEATNCIHDGLVNPIKPLVFSNCEGLDLQVGVYSRKTHGDSNRRLITVCIVNRTGTVDNSAKDEFCLFQTHFEVSVFKPDGEGLIHPYPQIEKSVPDLEEESLDLLYRSAQTYAIGHGCAANWGDKTDNNCVLTVSAECLPICEVPSVTPDIMDENNQPVEVSMAELGGIVDGKDGFDSLEKVIKLYENWINIKEKEIRILDERYHKAASRHLEECKTCLKRMREGFEYLSVDTDDSRIALRAFQLMNYAMLMQQVNSRIETRRVSFDSKSKKFQIASHTKPDYRNLSQGLGKWRAFQIGFLLMSIRSAMDELVPDRETVDLIWFPTGGGKTEAYLGLAAFSMFVRRLKDPADTGVNVLMRYTLRLLTTQQFQRAASLTCAMEVIRRENLADLGDSEFSIGIWLGGDTTPNTRQKAKEALHKLQRKTNEENVFILDRCPWCGAQMGKYKKRGGNTSAPKVIGYEESAGTVLFKCIDNECPFHNKLPIYVIDEDIYDYRPSIIIGTIDKFAMLPWRPEARSIFGLDEKGTRICSPPGIIIQDELHLISGPLGSLAGLYETVIEQLCTDFRKDHPIPPKIICSTATIRRYKQQILDLYARDKVMLYPPPGLDISDSFFSQYDRYPDGKLRPGRQYVGVHAPSLGSMQTVQVRTFSTLLQAPVLWDDENRDPWWTLLVFFNSLRELGTTVSLLQSDIPDYLKVIKNRVGLDYSQRRRLNQVKELTGRLPSEQIPEAIEELKVTTTNKNGFPIDVCLASNIIEVGIDIDRLSLMSIVGQPKTTAQYIQVSGRVGRKWREKPGLVITLYGASKPRDRSHFEKFKSYHQRLYAQVEPTSVTPFSAPALERALHSVLVSYIRHIGAKSSPKPFPEDLAYDFEKLLLDRVAQVDPSESGTAKKIIEKRFNQWRRWMPLTWSDSRDDNIPLLRRAGAYAVTEVKNRSWATLMSMRNVDAECKAEIMLPPSDEEEM